MRNFDFDLCEISMGSAISITPSQASSVPSNEVGGRASGVRLPKPNAAGGMKAPQRQRSQQSERRDRDRDRWRSRSGRSYRQRLARQTSSVHPPRVDRARHRTGATGEGRDAGGRPHCPTNERRALGGSNRLVALLAGASRCCRHERAVRSQLSMVTRLLLRRHLDHEQDIKRMLHKSTSCYIVTLSIRGWVQHERGHAHAHAHAHAVL